MVANSFLQKKVRYENLISRSFIKTKQFLQEVNRVTTAGSLQPASSYKNSLQTPIPDSMG